MNLLAELGWKYIARIKRNCLLDGERISGKWPQRFGQARGHLKQVSQEVRIIKDGKRYWATNDLALKPAAIKSRIARGSRLKRRFDS